MRSTIFYMLRSLGVVNLKAITISDRVLGEISDNNYDVILLGHNGSDSLSGIQLLEECRYRGYIKASACWMFMTSDASQEIVLHAVDSRPDGVIMKPFSVDELKHRLDSILRRKALFEPVEEALEVGDYPAAINYSRTGFAPYDAEYEEAQLVLARLLCQFQRYEEAAKVAEAQYWKSHDKDFGLVWAQALMGLEALDKAEKLLQGIIEEYPLFITAYDMLAKVHERSGELERARVIVQEATARSPMGIPRQMELGRLATQTKHLDVAGSAYRKSIVLGRKSCYRSPDPYLKLANIRRIEMQSSEGAVASELYNDFEKTIEQAQRAFPANPALQVQSALLRSEMFNQIGEVDEANRCTREAQRINDELEEPLNLDRELLAVTGDVVPILEPEQKVQRAKGKPRDPDMSVKVNRLGIKHYLAGKMPQALKYFGLAVEYDVANAAALLNLAQLFLESARDSQEKRNERLRMVSRYLRLAAKLTLEPEQRQKQQILQHYLQQGTVDLPVGSLGNLLR